MNSTRKYSIYVLLLLGILTPALFSACTQKNDHQHSSNEKEVYTCPMHPQVISDKPADCPMCGMKLEKKVAAEGLKNKDEIASLAEDVNTTVTGNFKTTYPKNKESATGITANGTIDYDQTNTNTVSARVTGRIEKLYIKYPDQAVSKGTKLMQLYSPELASAQRDLLFVIKNKDESLINASKQKLSNMGLTNAEIQQVIKTGKVIDRIAIYSPYSGISTQISTASSMAEASSNSSMGMSDSKSQSQQTSNAQINVREGMYVNKGQVVFELKNNSQIWAILNIFSSDLKNIKVGNKVELHTVADPNTIIQGKVNFIPPYLNKDEKTIPIRVYLPNNGTQFKIGSYIQAMVHIAKTEQGTYVPETAVYRLGQRSIVWVEDPKAKVYRYREIKTGNNNNGWVEVLSGLSKEEKVVVNAAFMVDSDSFIN